MFKFLPLGGSGSIGASCYYLYLNGTGILLDCGVDPRKKGLESLPQFELLESQPLDFVFISHAHQDHIGALPFLIQKFPHVIIYATPQTREIAELTLHNAVNIIQDQIEENPALKIYTHEEVDMLVRSMREIEYDYPLELKGLRHNVDEAVKISFVDAGHILGSASIIIEHSGEIIFYSGDINLSDQSIMKGTDAGKMPRVTTLILETTYGATDPLKTGSWHKETDRFVRAINSILHKDGSVLIPVFALGKMQEILSVLHYSRLKGKLTEAFIYTGGIGREISKIYDKYRFTVNRKNPELELKEIPQLNYQEVNDNRIFENKNGIILASSGMMLEGTTSFKLLDYWLGRKNFGIFAVGYMDPDSPGYKVINSSTGDLIKLTDSGKEYKIECSLNRFYFRSHSSRDELLSIVDKTDPAKVILIHGESEARKWVGNQIIKKKNRRKVFLPEIGKELEV